MDQHPYDLQGPRRAAHQGHRQYRGVGQTIGHYRRPTCAVYAGHARRMAERGSPHAHGVHRARPGRSGSAEHTSEPPADMRTSYTLFCFIKEIESTEQYTTDKYAHHL